MKSTIRPGDTFGRLTTLSKFKGSRKVRAGWLCQCECGNQHRVVTADLSSGNTLSCGCGSSRHTVGSHTKTHGMSKTPLYLSWRAMLNRCRNPNVKGYDRYGGRGISVCARWAKFENFLADMGERPFKGATLERIDNDGPYSPRNCVWASRKVQALNTRRSIWFTKDGKTLRLSDWSKVVGISYGTLQQRKRAGHSIDRILEPRKRINQFE